MLITYRQVVQEVNAKAHAVIAAAKGKPGENKHTDRLDRHTYIRQLKLLTRGYLRQTRVSKAATVAGSTIALGKTFFLL